MPRLTTRDYKRSSRGSGAAKLKEFGLGVLVGAALASAAFLIAGAHARHRAAASAHTHAAAESQGSAPHAPAPDDASSNSSDAATGTSDPDSSPHSASGHGGAQAPQYDFYRMLPSFKVPVAHDENRQSHAPPPAANPPERAAGAGPAYLLQVGSYHSAAEADQVRARLARAGITAQVQRIVSGSRILNRVRIGPLSDAQLARVREQLRTANIHVLVIRADR
ncbi:MAG: SPOR domain-containing protein [Gammaproteobacteria bacterium]|nr:SPOR domain-containing protein [Gammaproteobacteria bacterium]